MRPWSAFIAAAVLACGGVAAAQPVAPLPQQAQPPGSVKTDKSAADEAAAADQALAMTIRAQKEQDERIARIACAAGDKEKCAQLEKAATTSKTPPP